MTRAFLVASIVAITVAGCAGFPAAGPSTGEIVSAKDDAASGRYEVFDVDPTVTAALAGRSDNTFAGSFGGASGGTSDAIGIGDVVAVTIWEAGNGGLFSAPMGTLSSGSKSAAIPEQPVSQAGTIVVPYAGSIRAAGRTPDQVKATIEQALAGKAIEPQVLVSVTRPVYNTATVTGEVTTGGRVPLSGRGDRLLDVIAGAGGLRAPAHEIFVQLNRGRQSSRVPLQRVIDNPSENIPIRAGDTISLLRDPQTFTAFGATGRNAEVTFDATGTSLTEALGKVGGLLDGRADPAGVFVFRYEDPAVVRQIRPDSPLLAAGGLIPVVYRINLREPAGLFVARGFEIADKDVLYVTNAPATELQKFLVLLNLGVGSARNVVATRADLLE